MMELLCSLIDKDETDYDQLAQLGPDAVPFLLEITKAGNKRLAPRAVYAASLIEDKQSMDVLLEGASSLLVDIRVAAAAGIRNVGAYISSDFVEYLLRDDEMSVKKITLNSLLAQEKLSDNIQPTTLHSDNLQTMLKSMAENEPVEYIRDLAHQVHHQMSQ